MSKQIKKEVCIYSHATPITKNEINDLYEYESAMCKIVFKIKKDGQIINYSGTGFFCEINNDNILIKKALFTNNHILDENSIETNKEIEFEYLNEKKKIRITNDRKKITNNEFDYTCIEIFDSDKINNFLELIKQFLKIKIN